MDLEKSSTLFDASARLETAAAALRSIAEDNTTRVDRGALLWAGEFLTDVDWDSRTHSEGGRLAMQATRVRPTFYATVLQVRSQLESEGLKTQDEIAGFFEEVYKLLQSGGDVRLENRRVSLAANFLHRLAQGILSELTRPALSRPSTMTR